MSPNEARPGAGHSRSPPRPRRGAQRASPSRWRRRPGRAVGTASGCHGAGQDGSGAAGSAVRDGAISECARSPRPPPEAHIQPLGESWPGHWVGRKPPNRGNRGPGVRTRTHSGTHTWCSVQQWRRITASVRRATVHAAFSSAPRRPPATAPRRVRPRDAMDLRILCSWGGKGGNRGLGKSAMGRPQGGRGWGPVPPYLLTTAGGSHPTPPTAGRRPSLVCLNEMQVSGAWPARFGPWPTLPHSSLQVLEDDSAVVA